MPKEKRFKLENLTESEYYLLKYRLDQIRIECELFKEENNDRSKQS
jgi:hypothetical protein